MVRLLSGLLLTAGMMAGAQGVDERFENLMKDILVVDLHVDTPRYVLDEDYDFGIQHAFYEADIPRLRKGHVGAVFFGLFATPESFAPHLWVSRTLDLVDCVHEMGRRYSKDLEVAYTADDIHRIRSQGRIAALLSIEGGHQIQDDLRILRNYYRLGARYMTLTHFKTNNWADSETDTKVHGGLTDFGRAVVREMNRLGMMVDISHVSDKTFYDVMEASRAPAIASHSSVRSICNAPRNMSDDMIRALAARGGVVFVNFNAAYLDQKAWETHRDTRAQRDREISDLNAAHQGDPKRFELVRAIQRRYQRMLPTVDYKLALRHIDHIVKLVGPDHAGLGSDFDGVSGMVPKGLEDVSKFPVLVRGMLELGYAEGDIRKIMGENLIRVMKKTEQASRETNR